MPFRSRLAFYALGVVLLQLTVLFAAPFSACCVTPDSRTRSASSRSADVEDCCPPGSHPPGQCPRHRGARRPGTDGRTAATECRIRCTAEQRAGLITGPIAVMPRPAVAVVATIPHDLYVAAEPAPNVPSAHPDAPPPKLL
jgi:hypothetical protein